MLQSINLDNIPDDALFESGTGAWNQNSSQTPVIRRQNLGNHTTIMTLQNQEETRNISGAESQGVNMERQNSGRRQVLQPVASQQTRSSASPEVLMDVFEPSNGSVQPHQNATRQEHGGARAKTTKNKENKNKNAMKRNVNESGCNEGISRHSQSPSKTVWEPELRLKQYRNEDDEGGSSLTNKKIVNQSKQNKQNINRNAAMSQNLTGPAFRDCDNDSLLSFASIPLPAGLDPVSNPRNINHFYIKNPSNEQQSRDTEDDIDLETDFYSVRHVGKDSNKVQNSSPKVLETSNIQNIHNDLWEGKNKERDKGNKNVTHIILDQSSNNAVHVIQNDLDIESRSQDRNRTLLKLPNNLSLPRPSSDSRLESQSIVVPYEHNNMGDNSLQMSRVSASAGSSPQSVISTISFTTSPTSTLTNSLMQDSLNFSDSLPSNLSSNVLFGDGVSNDYLYAQKLQQQYDREHEILQRQRQYDIPPNNRRYVIPTDEHFSLHTPQVTSQNNEEECLNTTDFTTAVEFQNLSDSLTTDITPVYDPSEDGPVNTGESLYIPLENSTEQQAETKGNGDDSVRPSCSDIVISHQIENDDSYPQSVPPRDPIVVRFNQESDIISPSEHSLEAFDSLVARGSGTRQSSRQVDDAAYARIIQEQQDEEYARMLQEQESEEDHHHGNRVNLVNLERNNTGGNYQPLHTRFGHTWRNRPLRVGPPIGGVANNVADSRVRSRNTWDRPLQQRQENESEFGYLDNVHSLSINEGYDIPPGQDYYYRYNDPDFMLDDYGEDRLISINRDPQLLATLLMTRAPDMMIPNNVDLNDYEALWELAENLGEVRRVGMDQNDISLLPVHTYKAPTSGENEDNKTDCLVCLSEFSEGERLRTLPCCHIYHVDCIDEWLRRNAVCPVCRQSPLQRE